MARMMKPGLRVVRGKNWDQNGQVWDSSQTDKNGPGTVIREHPDSKNLWQVKWDRTGKIVYHQMGADNFRSGEKIYRLKIMNFCLTATQKNSSLGKKLFMAKSTYDMKIICEG